jgi:hypothetical protein
LKKPAVGRLNSKIDVNYSKGAVQAENDELEEVPVKGGKHSWGKLYGFSNLNWCVSVVWKIETL